MAQRYKDVPDLLKHCTVAIFRAGRVKGSDDREKFIGAWKIARASLTKYGYLQPGSEEGPLESIKFTHKGAGKTRPHTLEGRTKSKFFDKMSQILEEEDRKVVPEGKSVGDGTPEGQKVAAEVNKLGLHQKKVEVATGLLAADKKEAKKLNEQGKTKPMPDKIADAQAAAQSGVKLVPKPMKLAHKQKPRSKKLKQDKTRTRRVKAAKRARVRKAKKA